MVVFGGIKKDVQQGNFSTNQTLSYDFGNFYIFLIFRDKGLVRD